MICIDPSIENAAVRVAERVMRWKPNLDLRVEPQWKCPSCGNDIMDLLVWQYEFRDYVFYEEADCSLCETHYVPGEGGE